MTDRESPSPNVCSSDAAPEISIALQSLARQPVPLENVVVSSGGGDQHSALPGHDLNVKLISVPHPLWPGAPRNTGIKASRAPWVAFMASDHVAKDELYNGLKIPAIQPSDARLSDYQGNQP